MNKQLKDNELDGLLRDRFAQAKITPPNGVFERVRAGLEVPPKSLWARLPWRMAAVAALLLWPIFGEWMPANEGEQQGWSVSDPVASSEATVADVVAAEIPEMVQKNPVIKNEAILPPSPPIAVTSKTPAVPINPQQAKQLPFGNKPAATTAIVGAAEASPLAAWQPIEWTAVPLPVLEEVMPKQAIALKPEKKAVPYSMYIGMHGRISSVGIINQNTYGAFGKEELNGKSSVGFTYGLHAGKRISDNIWLEIGANFLSRQGQEYHDVINGRPVYRAVSLVYHQVPILLKYEGAFGFGKRRLHSYWEGGLQYGYLLIARIQVNDTDKGFYRRFNKDEWSLMLGKSVDLPLSDHAVLNIGLHTTISNDINADGWAVADNYGKSHNITSGLRLSLRFH